MAESSERDAARVGEFHLADADVVAADGPVAPGYGAAPGRTVLEPGGDAELDSPWRPSRPSLASSASASGEVAPFSATGIHGRRSGFVGALSRWRFAGLGAGLALVLGLGAVWLARPVAVEVESTPAAAVTPAENALAPVSQTQEAPPAQEPGAPARAEGEPSQVERVAAEPKVMPVVVPASKAVQTRAHALQPAKPAPPKASPEARASRTGETSSGGAGLRETLDWDEPNPESDPAPPRASSARNAAGTGEDPWNPESFGDRR